MEPKPTRQVRWTSEFPADLLDKALIWGLKQAPPLRTKSAVLAALVRKGLKA